MIKDRENDGKIVGFLNGIATNERIFRDEFFTDESLHEPDGETVMIMGLDVLREYRKMGLARELVFNYCRKEQARVRRNKFMNKKLLIEFKNHIDLGDLIKKYNHSFDEYVTMQIGFDGNVYILFNKNIPERIDGMFVPTESNSNYSVLLLQIDWNEEKIINEKYYDLGVQKMNYSFVQPISEGLLLVSSRCRFNKGNPENNAAIVDFNGNIIDEFCLGDGISHCFVHPDLGIVIGYFDEGVFGNYGWNNPLGACGVRVWGRGGQDIWQADKNIYDCYAMNISETGTIWYYYYDEFKLVNASINNSCEREYVPEIDGAVSLIISKDNLTIMMDKGYDANDEFVAKKIIDDKLCDEVHISFMYQGKCRKVSLISSYGSKAAFVENGTCLFLRSF